MIDFLVDLYYAGASLADAARLFEERYGEKIPDTVLASVLGAIYEIRGDKWGEKFEIL